jgi:magnesium-dependent phosphatase 1
MIWTQGLTFPKTVSMTVLLVTLIRRHFCQQTCPRLNGNVSKFSSCMAQPKLIVFDLDYTLWPFWVDTHVDPPFHMAPNGKVYDCNNKHITHYEDVPNILKRLHGEGFKLGIASRTGALHEACDLTRLFNWDQFFHFRHIFPGSKIAHFKKLHAESGIAYEDMLFFDDEHRNIVDVFTLGVTCKLVPDGVSEKSFKEGMELFQIRNKERSGQS